ncbi:MAG: class I SAM-dependent methyltransferase [Pyrinomonadaceae bacterium]
MNNTGTQEKRVFDQNKAEAFAGDLLQTLNSGGVALMISIGHRTGLFDKLAELPPSNSAEIAEAAGLNERYVREWLGSMVTGRIVEFEEENGKYHLPQEHSAFLTRAAVSNNMASIAQFVPLLGQVEDEIIECFKKGGGVPYSSFPRFHQVMAEESGNTVLPALVDSILPLADGIVEKLKRGIDVLDVGCGSGRALVLMAKTFPNSSFTGYDFSEEAIGNARREAENAGLSNIRFEVRDAVTIGEAGKYDLITAFDAIHDQAKPAEVLKGIAVSLKEGGTFLMQDITGSSHVGKNLDHPVAPLMYTISCMHCMTVSLANDGDGLGAMWGEEKALELLDEAGFGSIRVNRLDHDILNNYYVCRKN